MGSPYSFRWSGTLCTASACFKMFPTAASFLGRKIFSLFFSRKKCFCLILWGKMMMSHHTRLREKNGDLHLLVRFGHRTKAANFFICTHLSRVKRKAIVKNIFHCSLGEPSYHGTPWRIYSQYSVIIYSIYRGTDGKVVEMERDLLL